MPTKDSISKIFNQLERFGFEVYNFNTGRSVSKGMKGFPDYVIIGKKNIFFIEVKRKGDTMRPDQERFAEIIKPITVKKDSNVFYLIIHNDRDAVNFVSYLLEMKEG